VHSSSARFSEVSHHLKESFVLIGIMRILEELGLLRIVTAKLLQKSMCAHLFCGRTEPDVEKDDRFTKKIELEETEEDTRNNLILPVRLGVFSESPQDFL